ncbi:hypothetical protein X875_15930 [Mannheimia varigena USDA-ARS-USMARC-1388]|nr:hypothetical protein X875_15930 [Mannheimia varigena USDA-ARS-USMARC-1388]
MNFENDCPNIRENLQIIAEIGLKVRNKNTQAVIFTQFFAKF